MRCELCSKELNKDEIEECKLVCSKCSEKLKSLEWWDKEGRTKLMRSINEAMNWKRKAELRGRFELKVIDFLKTKNLYEDFLKYLGSKTDLS